MAMQRKRPANVSTLDPLLATTLREDAAVAKQTAVPARTRNDKAVQGDKLLKVKAVKPAKPLKPAKASKASTATDQAKADKPKKPKLMRDSFTIPKTEYAVIESLKQRAALGGRPAKKSELLRAGLKALAAMDDPGFMAAIGQVPAIKTGRPTKA